MGPGSGQYRRDRVVDVEGCRGGVSDGISRSTAYECVRRGEIPSRRLGRRVVVLRRELERMLGTSGAPAVQTDVRKGR
jgi:Helix-turn-helix domain